MGRLNSTMLNTVTNVLKSSQDVKVYSIARTESDCVDDVVAEIKRDLKSMTRSPKDVTVVVSVR